MRIEPAEPTHDARHTNRAPSARAVGGPGTGGPSPAASRIGPLIVVTDRGQAAAAGHDLVDVVAAAIAGGARTVLLREKDLPTRERTLLAESLAALLAPVDGVLLVAGDPTLGQTVGASGIHLTANQPHWSAFWRVVIRGSSAGGPVVGRSCHDLEELRAALVEGVDYVTFSPIWVTASKPGYGPGVGITGIAEAVAAVPDLPIYALGGVEPGRAAPCQAAGAAGVAVMGAIMRADDPAAVVHSLVAELTSDEPRWPRRSALA